MASLKAPAGSLRERDTKFYELLSGGAKFKLLEAFLDLRLGQLIGTSETGSMSAAHIIKVLKLHPHRGWKFLHALSLAGFLNEENGAEGNDSSRYSLSEDTIRYFGADCSQTYFFGDLLDYHRYLTETINVPFVDVLKGAEFPVNMVVWPPATPEAQAHVEHWMTITAAGAIRTVVESRAMIGARSLLDVGGGDGTIAIALARNPELSLESIVVFNLPAACALATANIAKNGLSDKIKTHVGDFLADSLPEGFDRVMFSRVLTDWDYNTCKLLLGKAKAALAPGGRIVINEAFLDGNVDYSTAWEFRYIFYDSFGRAMYKPVDVYRQILSELGMRVVSVAPMLDEAFYSVLEAEVV